MPDTVTAIVEGFVKMGIFVGYLSAVSLMPDIKRTFMYHGAEHKSIFCFEKKMPLSPENAKNFGRFHPRCGTSFLILMVLVSILGHIFAAIPFIGWLFSIAANLVSFALFCIGIIGEYVGRTFEQSKERPVYIAKEILDYSK